MKFQMAKLIALAGLAALGGCDNREAAREFRARLGKTSVTVFPAVVWSGGRVTHDEEAAREIAEFLERRKLARATVAGERLTLNTRGGRNEAGMYRRSREAFVEYLKAHPVETEYALIAEYLVARNGVAGGVHGYLVNARGVAAYGFLLNSHQRLFRKIKPRSNADCRRLIVEFLERELKMRGA